jgi:hypothetical protein
MGKPSKRQRRDASAAHTLKGKGIQHEASALDLLLSDDLKDQLIANG